MEIYCCEVGFLLKPEDVEFENYAIVYDKKYGYSDYNQIAFKSKEEAIEYSKKFFKDNLAKDMEYAIITYQGKLDIEEKDFDDGNIEGFTYNVEDVVYSAYLKNGEIVTDFIQKV